MQRISALLPLEPTLTERVLQATLPGKTSSIAALFADSRLTQRASDGSFVTPSDRASFGAIFDAFVVLDKLRIVLARWRVGNRDATWLLQHAGEVGWLELHTLPANASAGVALSKLVILRSNVSFSRRWWPRTRRGCSTSCCSGPVRATWWRRPWLRSAAGRVMT